MLRESNRFPITVELMILVVAALTGPKMGKVVDELDRGNPFHLLETELIFTPQSQGRAVQHADRLAIHVIREDRQRVTHIGNLVYIVVSAALTAIRERIEDKIACIRLSAVRDPECVSSQHRSIWRRPTTLECKSAW
jgi:hypothetical protein